MSSQATQASLPLDGARGLRGDVIHHTVHAAHAIADARGHVLEKLGLERIPAKEIPCTFEDFNLRLGKVQVQHMKARGAGNRGPARPGVALRSCTADTANTQPLMS